MNDDVQGMNEDLVAALLKATDVWQHERDPEPLERVLRRMRAEEARKLNSSGTVIFTPEELAEHDARVREVALRVRQDRRRLPRVLPWWRP